jgi:hypothetical protein
MLDRSWGIQTTTGMILGPFSLAGNPSAFNHAKNLKISKKLIGCLGVFSKEGFHNEAIIARLNIKNFIKHTFLTVF